MLGRRSSFKERGLRPLFQFSPPLLEGEDDEEGEGDR